MIKVSLKDLKQFAKDYHTIDITYKKDEEIQKIKKSEKGLTTILWSQGIYGETGEILKGEKTGKFYAILSRTSAIYSV